MPHFQPLNSPQDPKMDFQIYQYCTCNIKKFPSRKITYAGQSLKELANVRGSYPPHIQLFLLALFFKVQKSMQLMQ
jgi:hypothetical protein